MCLRKAAVCLHWRGEHYGTDILCRGNLIRVKGSEEKVYKSLSVIEEILSDAKRGIRVSERQMLLIMKLLMRGRWNCFMR